MHGRLTLLSNADALFTAWGHEFIVDAVFLRMAKWNQIAFEMHGLSSLKELSSF